MPDPDARTPEGAAAITAERLERWRAKLKAEGATPMLLVGVMHGERASGLVVLIPEGVPTEEVALLASKAAIGLANLARTEAKAKAGEGWRPDGEGGG